MTRSVMEQSSQQNTPLTLFRSANPRTLIFDFTGLCTSTPTILKALHEKYGDMVSGVVPQSRTPRIVVTFKADTDLAQVERDGYIFNEVSVPIHRTYAQKANLLLVTLLNTPVYDAIKLSTFLQGEMAKYGSVHDMRLCYWPDAPNWLMPRAVVLFDLDKSPHILDKLPSIIRCPETGAEISLHWRGGPKSCRYCKQIGHTIGECDKRTKYTKRARLESDSSTEIAASSPESAPTRSEIAVASTSASTSAWAPPLLSNQSTSTQKDTVTEQAPIAIIESPEIAPTESDTDANMAIDEPLKKDNKKKEQKHQKKRKAYMTANKIIVNQLVDDLPRTRSGKKTDTTTTTPAIPLPSGGDWTMMMENDSSSQLDSAAMVTDEQ